MPAAAATRRRWFFGVLFAGYTVFLAFVLGWPTPVDAPFAGEFRQLLGQLHSYGVPTWVDYAEIESAANVVLFFPVGLLLTLALRHGRWWVAVLGGLGLSLLAETAQEALRPERFATPRDVLANTAGTVVGAGFGALFTHRRARSEARRRASGYARAVPDSSLAYRYRHPLRWALAGYMAILVYVLGWPTPTVQVVWTLDGVYGLVRDLGASPWVRPLDLEFAANIALFVPFGLLLALVLRRERWRAVFGGIGVSLLAEIAQGLLRPDRSGTLSDVVANTAGTVIGVGLALLLARRRSRSEVHLGAQHLVAVEHTAHADLGQPRVEQVGPVTW